MNQDQAKRYGRDIAMFGDVEDYDVETIVEVLKHADDMYYNGDGSFLTDADYDAIRQYAYQQEPHHSYFTGIGSEVRGGKVPLPYTMGSLDQVDDFDEVKRWIDQHQLHNMTVIITEKLDGTSAMVIYDENGNLQIAYSRGDGKQGADITRHIKHFVPNQINTDGKRLVVRGEVIIPKDQFPELRSSVRTRAGEMYKNPRNMVAGLMNAEKNDKSVYQYINFVAYDIINHTTPKRDQLQYLEQAGFETPLWVPVSGNDILGNGPNYDSGLFLTDHLNKCRHQSAYEIDGIVIDINTQSLREQLAPDNDDLNPSYAVKYKVADQSNLAEANVVDVLWKASKHGYMKPRVQIEPTDLAGVTVQHATAFNAKFISENRIGPGAVIKITRSGDVIPYILEVTKSAKAKMPDEEWEWNDTGVDAVMVDFERNEGVLLERLVDFFSALEAPHLKKGNVQKLYEAGYERPEDVINMHEQEMIDIFGHANGTKIYQGLFDRLEHNGIELYELIGAHATARGIGQRKIKKLQKAVGQDRLLAADLTVSEIDEVEGFDTKTAHKVVHELQQFKDFWNKVKHNVTLVAKVNTSGGSMEDEKVVFTGFRSPELAAQVEAEGGEIQNSASGKTTIVVAKDPNSSSGKIKKARDAGAKIVGIDEFEEML